MTAAMILIGTLILICFGAILWLCVGIARDRREAVKLSSLYFNLWYERLKEEERNS